MDNGSGEGPPLVSVVVPTKDRADYLPITLESILSQDYPRIECIVVAAPSTDGTIDVLKSYGDRIHWISAPDRGAFDAINKGWHLSSGEIITWLNDDDVWNQGAVAEAVAQFSRHPDVDVIYGECGVIDDKGNTINHLQAVPWDLHRALKYCDHIINQSAAFMRRSLVERIGWLYPAWCHDHDLWLRIGAAGGKFMAIPFKLASVRQWPENLGTNPDIVIPAKIGLTKRFFASPDIPGALRPLRRRAISNAYLRGSYYVPLRKLGDWLRVSRLLAAALASDPSNLPYISRQLVLGLVRRTFLGSIARRSAAGLRVAARPLRTAVKILSLLPGGVIYTGPVAALLLGLGIASLARLPSLESRASVFFFVTAPILAAFFWYDLRRRRR